MVGNKNCVEAEILSLACLVLPLDTRRGAAHLKAETERTLGHGPIVTTVRGYEASARH